MKINRQSQELYTLTQSADWVLKQQIERDVCLLYHQVANAGYLQGDLYSGSVFTFAYWEYLDFPGIDPEDRDFLRDGCLVMILAMALDQINESGYYIGPHIPACRTAIEQLRAGDEDTRKLARTVSLALDAAERGVPESEELSKLSGWVYNRYVQGYFRSHLDTDS